MLQLTAFTKGAYRRPKSYEKVTFKISKNNFQIPKLDSSGTATQNWFIHQNDIRSPTFIYHKPDSFSIGTRLIQKLFCQEILSCTQLVP